MYALPHPLPNPNALGLRPALAMPLWWTVPRTVLPHPGAPMACRHACRFALFAVALVSARALGQSHPCPLLPRLLPGRLGRVSLPMVSPVRWCQAPRLARAGPAHPLPWEWSLVRLWRHNARTLNVPLSGPAGQGARHVQVTGPSARCVQPLW